MKNSFLKYVLIFCLGLVTTCLCVSFLNEKEHDKIVFHEVNPKLKTLKMFWKDSLGNKYKNFEFLKNDLKTTNNELLFAMNGGMFLEDFSPQGLYVENGMELKQLDTIQNAYGNFYLQPNGVFYLKKDGSTSVVKSVDFKKDTLVTYATQSGPMLVVDGKLHSAFKKGSSNVYIRNGVGVLPNGHLLFAISTEKINFYDFATFFKNKGCENALYLDGFVSKMYLPEKDFIQLDGNFGVIIGEVKLLK